MVRSFNPHQSGIRNLRKRQLRMRDRHFFVERPVKNQCAAGNGVEGQWRHVRKVLEVVDLACFAAAEERYGLSCLEGYFQNNGVIDAS